MCVGTWGECVDYVFPMVEMRNLSKLKTVHPILILMYLNNASYMNVFAHPLSACSIFASRYAGSISRPTQIPGYSYL